MSVACCHLTELNEFHIFISQIYLSWESFENLDRELSAGEGLLCVLHSCQEICFELKFSYNIGLFRELTSLSLLFYKISFPQYKVYQSRKLSSKVVFCSPSHGLLARTDIHVFVPGVYGASS